MKYKILLLLSLLININNYAQDEDNTKSISIKTTTPKVDGKSTTTDTITKNSKTNNKKNNSKKEQEKVIVTEIDTTILYFKKLKVEQEKELLLNQLKENKQLIKEINDVFFTKMLSNFYSVENIKKESFDEQDSMKIQKYNLMIKSISYDESQIKSKSIIVQAKKYNEIYFFLLDTKSILNKEFDSIKIKNSITKLEKLSIDKDFIGLENNRLEQIKILNDYISIYKDFTTKLKNADSKIKNIEGRKALVESLKNKNKNKNINYPYLQKIIDEYPFLKEEFKY